MIQLSDTARSEIEKAVVKAGSDKAVRIYIAGYG